MLIIKIVSNNETRRLAVEKIMPFETLQQLIKNLFNVDECPKIKYADSDGDVCIIASDLELEECVRQSNGNIIRLIVDGIKEDVSELPTLDIADSSSFFKVEENSNLYVEQKQQSQVPQEEKKEVKLYPEDNDYAKYNDAMTEVHPDTPNTKIDNIKKDLSILDTIEKQLKAAFDSIASFMDSIQFVQTCQTHLQNASQKLDEKLVQPLQQITKAKADDFKIEMSKLHIEIKRLRDLLTAEISKIPDAITSLANSIEKKENVVVVEKPKEQKVVEKEMQELINSMDFKQLPTDVVPSPAPVQQQIVQPQPGPIDPAAQLLQDDLARLLSMGFTNQKRNLELLGKHKGNIMAVVEELIQ